MMSTLGERAQRLEPIARQLMQACAETNLSWAYDLLHVAYNMGQSDGFDKALALNVTDS
jgi:hypothetical protein